LGFGIGLSGLLQGRGQTQTLDSFHQAIEPGQQLVNSGVGSHDASRVQLKLLSDRFQGSLVSGEQGGVDGGRGWLASVWHGGNFGFSRSVQGLMYRVDSEHPSGRLP
jgi:hypothetical protein